MNTFEEEQRLPHSVAMIIYGILAITLAIIYMTTPPTPERNIALIALLPSFAFTALLFQTAKMKTRVGDTGVAIDTLYVVKRRIGFDEIESAEATEYRPLRDYGGWGLRISGKGKAYNMRGDRGVQLVLKNGGRVLIGSQRDQELEAAIRAGLR